MKTPRELSTPTCPEVTMKEPLAVTETCGSVDPL